MVSGWVHRHQLIVIRGVPLRAGKAARRREAAVSPRCTRASAAFLGTSRKANEVTEGRADLAGGGATDRFRIKIWRYDENLKQDVVVYDNQLGSTTEGTSAEGTAISGGVITIHASKN
jgi:hypothetical protein